MKRLGNLFERIIDKENIRLAHFNAQKGKTFYKEVKMVNADIDFYVESIHRMLADKTFKNAPYEIVYKRCSGKDREIYKLPYYPDRIIHHAIMQIVEPIWQSVLIDATYSSIKGRGIHTGLKRLKIDLENVEKTQYCLKLDIKKFYPSVNNAVLKSIVRRKIKDEDLLWLLDEIIDSTQGVPIGNYLSQYLSNVYLAYFDHYCKEVLSIKYYHRYCDDIVILHSSKEHLHTVYKVIETYLNDVLKLQVKSNYQVFPVAVRGIDFLGYRFYHTHILLRKRIAKAMKRAVRKKGPSTAAASYYGWCKHANCYNLRQKYLKDYESKFKRKAS